MNYMNIILYGVCIAGGLIFFAVAFSQYSKAKKAAETWLTAPGVVTSSTVTVHRSRNSKGVTTTTYMPEVAYEYKVSDQKYTGDHIGFGKATYGKGKADTIIAGYSQGAQVTVHYDPVDPSKAVLETKAASGGNFIALGVILLAMGLIAMFVLPK